MDACPSPRGRAETKSVATEFTRSRAATDLARSRAANELVRDSATFAIGSATVSEFARGRDILFAVNRVSSTYFAVDFCVSGHRQLATRLSDLRDV